MRRIVAIVVVAAALIAACDRIVELSPAPDAHTAPGDANGDGGNDDGGNDSAVPGDAAVVD
jgi:hypothetical protein